MLNDYVENNRAVPNVPMNGTSSSNRLDAGSQVSDEPNLIPATRNCVKAPYSGLTRRYEERPPSAAIMVPLTMRDSSAARNTAIAAMCSGSPSEKG